MRIVLIGQSAFGAETLKALLASGHDVLAVYTSTLAEMAAPVEDIARVKCLPLFQFQDMRSREVVESMTRLEPELGVMAFVTSTIPKGILSCPALGTIQYHPSLLPRHRGANAINWAIIKGETETGLTIFWPDEGMDTGPILLQKRVVISSEDTVGSLYFNRLFPLGIQSLVEAVDLIATGKASREQQDGTLASYEPPCNESHALINWEAPVSEVYNLIRGTNPQPGATTFWRQNKVKFYDSEKLESTVEGAPGEVIEINDRGIVIAARGGAILVKRLRLIDGPKISSKDCVKESGFSCGERFVP